MKINIYGMGYVGCVSAVCLAEAGHEVVGVDIDPVKVSLINQGKSPLIEPGLGEAVARETASGRLRASSSGSPEALVSMICVGTPSRDNGSLSLDHVERVTEEIGDAVRRRSRFHVVNVRSTVLPGAIEGRLVPILESRSDKRLGVDFGVCMNPEFMREGTSITDFHNPPFTVVGESDARSGEMVASLYEGIDAPLIRTSIKVAEMLKYACNAFHALKVTFANEIGNLSKSLGVDSHELMEIFCRDSKLNLSPYYLKPGFAFGGSCLPKDLRALLYQCKEVDLESPVLSSILASNRRQIEHAFKLVQKTERKKVGVLGFSFKPGSDDLRESPTVELVEKLVGKGYSVQLYDREVSLAKLFGANRQYIERVIPHISSLMKDSLQEVIDESEVIVIAKQSPEFAKALKQLNGECKVVDLVRQIDKERVTAEYEGICW